VLIVPTRGWSGLRSIAELAAPQVRRIGIGKWATVPAGRYAREAIERAGLWPLLQPRLIQADSVRQVLAYVARGEVDAGFVYSSDAQAFADRVRIATHIATATAIRYPAVVVHDSPHPALAREFVDFLLTPAAQATLARHGFAAP
jgi:molybdate transport system substrate-binding protein